MSNRCLNLGNGNMKTTFDCDYNPRHSFYSNVWSLHGNNCDRARFYTGDHPEFRRNSVYVARLSNSGQPGNTSSRHINNENPRIEQSFF